MSHNCVCVVSLSKVYVCINNSMLVHNVYLDLLIAVRLNQLGSRTRLFTKIVWHSVCLFIRTVTQSEVETPNNFCQFRFLKCVQIFIFYQIANLDVQIFVSVFRFSFSSNRKSRHTYLSRFSQVCIDLRTHLRKFGQVCLDLQFEENENLNTLTKIWTSRFAIL